MNTIATGQNSPNCQEEDLIKPVADNYFSHKSIYSLCQEEAVNMIPWNKGKTGVQKGYWTGKTFSDDHKKKLSNARNGWKLSEEAIKKRAESRIGYITSEVTKKKISEAQKGVPRDYMRGFHHTDETKQKISKANKGKPSLSKGKKRLDMQGEKSPFWRGGISFEPYCSKFNYELKEKIRERDNRTCQLCGTKENGRKLTVHHIHYDKPNCNPDLITLCLICNNKANFNRDFYENLFTDKLKKRNLTT